MHEDREPAGASYVVLDVWTFRSEPDLGDIDIVGYKVEATDGEIGTVDEATYDAGASYLVVDTGQWIFGKKVMLPAGVVERVDTESERVHVARTKDEIKNAPEYDPDRTPDDEYRTRLGEYYAER